MSTEHEFAPFIRILGKGKTGTRSLTQDEAVQAMSLILNNRVRPEQLGAFLMLLRVKEESDDELLGFVQSCRQHIQSPLPIEADLDWASYAGKRRHNNWYLLAALALADAGIRVLMHGAAGHTAGRQYSENALSALGIPASQSPEAASKAIQQNGFAFMPLAAFLPKLADIIELRSVLGLRSPVHTLSRLLNPAGLPYSMQSVFHPSYAPNHQSAAQKLGQQNAIVFKGEAGEVEYRPNADQQLFLLENGQTTIEQWNRQIDGRVDTQSELKAKELRSVWQSGSCSEYARLAIVGTIALALRMRGEVKSQEQAWPLAENVWRQRNLKRLR